MTSIQSIIGLFILLVIILSMGLQFSNFGKEGFISDNVNKKRNKKHINYDMPVQNKTNNSMAKQNMLNDLVPNY